MRASARRPSGVGVLVAVVAAATVALLCASAGSIVTAATDHPGELISFLALALVLQAVSVDVYGRGSISVSGIGLLGTGFALGVGPALLASVLTATVHAVRRRPAPHKAAFNASTFALATAAGVAVFQAIDGATASGFVRLGGSLAGSTVFTAVNLGLLTIAMGIAERERLRRVWRERFHWLTPHYIAFGPLALGAVVAYERVGPIGLMALSLPPVMMTLSVHQYLNRTREAVEEVREANTRLQDANDDLADANQDLAARNRDLAELLRLSSTLTAHAHDREALLRTSQEALEDLFNAPVRIDVSPEAPGRPLVAGGSTVGAIDVSPSADFDTDRWNRLSAILLPHLATALESATLVEEVRRRHVATIAALSRSMDAKDSYTGGHIERVSDVAVALARRLGYRGEDLEAVEVGALLHDIGKIGIPERIIQKPGPLDDGEWMLMKQHPLISEHILEGCELSPIVLQIARWSHERMDGRGYPDGLAADQIPLPARIVFVADAFDALTSDRSYRPGRSAEQALAEIRRHAGTQFCPSVVKALEALYEHEPEILGAPPLHAVGTAVA